MEAVNGMAEPSCTAVHVWSTRSGEAGEKTVVGLRGGDYNVNRLFG
jgi:hypothetical protein